MGMEMLVPRFCGEMVGRVAPFGLPGHGEI
jgi:hypothetical protein